MKTFALIALTTTAMALSSCSSNQVVDNTVGVTAGATKLVAKGAVGAVRLVYKGGQAVVNDNE